MAVDFERCHVNSSHRRLGKITAATFLTQKEHKK
jgi:hypothetical protein